MQSRPRTIGLLLTLALVIAACGSRRDAEELLAASSLNAGPSTEMAAGIVSDNAPAGAASDTVSTTPGASGTEAAATNAPEGGGGGASSGAASGGDTPEAAAQQAAAPEQASGGGPVAATKSPVVIGTVGTITGPVGDLVQGAIDGLRVWVQDVNTRGGLNGHPVEYIVADDGGDPSRYQALMRQMVEEQGAIAFLYNTLGFGAAGNTSYNEQNRIPILGHEGGTEAGYDNPMVFTANSAGQNYAHALMNGLADVVKPQGVKNIAVLACSDVKLCDTFFGVWTGDGAKKHGFNVVYSARPSLTQPDFTAECLAAKNANPPADAIIAAIDNNSYIRLGNSCDRQGYNPVVGIADQLALPSVAQADTLQGSVVSSRYVPWVKTDHPAVAELHQAFAKFMPGVPVNGAHIGGWTYGKLLEEAAANLPDDPTSEDILEGLYALESNLGGLTYTLNFSETSGSPRKTCWSSVAIEGHAFVAPFGELRCE